MANKNNDKSKVMEKTAGYQPLQKGHQPDSEIIEIDGGYQPKGDKVDVSNLKPPEGGTAASKPQSNDNKEK